MVGRAIIVVAALGVAIGAGISSSALSSVGSDGDPNRRAQEVVVTGNKEPNNPPTCGLAEAGARLSGLAEALRTVDVQALRSYWGPGFAWFTLHDGKVRHTGHDIEFGSYEEGVSFLERDGPIRIRFKDLEVGGSPGNYDASVGGQFDGIYWRRPRAKRPFFGKIEFDCGTPTIIALASAINNHGIGNIARCPEPRPPASPSALVVCRRS
jgi:hypothetical protein